MKEFERKEMQEIYDRLNGWDTRHDPRMADVGNALMLLIEIALEKDKVEQ